MPVRRDTPDLAKGIFEGVGTVELLLGGDTAAALLGGGECGSVFDLVRLWVVLVGVALVGITADRPPSRAGETPLLPLPFDVEEYNGLAVVPVSSTHHTPPLYSLSCSRQGQPPSSSLTSFPLLSLRSLYLRSFWRMICLWRSTSFSPFSTTRPSDNTLSNLALNTCSCGVITSGSPGLVGPAWCCCCREFIGLFARRAGLSLSSGSGDGLFKDNDPPACRRCRIGEGECEVLRAEGGCVERVALRGLLCGWGWGWWWWFCACCDCDCGMCCD